MDFAALNAIPIAVPTAMPRARLCIATPTATPSAIPKPKFMPSSLRFRLEHLLQEFSVSRPILLAGVEPNRKAAVNRSLAGMNEET